MDLCNKYDLKGQNSLFVTGIVGAYTEREISDFFGVNGDIAKVVRIPDEPGLPSGRVLIEYAADETIPRLDPAALGELPCPRNPDVTWHVETIRHVCQNELGRELAQRYLEELQALHGASKESFYSALQSELQTFHRDTRSPQLSDVHVHPRQSDPNPTRVDITSSSQYETMGAAVGPAGALNHSPHIDEAVFNPPHIQKVVVEHIMRSEQSPSSYSQSRVRTFSGRLPKPNGEVDYDAWRTQVELLHCDHTLSESQKVRRILESLLSPAADVVRSLGTQSSLQSYLVQLEAAFGVVEDGEELFAAFLSSNQNSGEKPSAYLNRLQVLLTKAISRGGVSAKDSDKHLLRQFCRGCWDQSLIVGLQLEHQKAKPPSFPEFLLLLRTEEDRRAAKLDRMRKHLGSAKAVSHVHSVYGVPTYDGSSEGPVSQKQDSTGRLEKEVAELKKQLASLTQKDKSDVQETSTLNRPAGNKGSVQGECLVAWAGNPQRTPKASSYLKPWFCFKCGQDGHIAAKCDNPENPALVRKKNSELRAKREKQQSRPQTSRETLNM